MQNYKVGRWWILFWLFVVGRLQCYGPKLFNDLLHLLLLSLGWWWHGRLLGSHLLGPLLLLRQSLQGLRLQTLPPVLHLLQLLLYLLGSQRGRLGAGSYFGLLWGFGIFKNNLQGRHLILTKFWKKYCWKLFIFYADLEAETSRLDILWFLFVSHLWRPEIRWSVSAPHNAAVSEQVIRVTLGAGVTCTGLSVSTSRCWTPTNPVTPAIQVFRNMKTFNMSLRICSLILPSYYTYV